MRGTTGERNDSALCYSSGQGVQTSGQTRNGHGAQMNRTWQQIGGEEGKMSHTTLRFWLVNPFSTYNQNEPFLKGKSALTI